MGITTCYARLTGPQLEQLSASPEPARVLYKTPPAGSERIDLDKAAEVIAWLLSPNKRAEQERDVSRLADRQQKPTPAAPEPKPNHRGALLDALAGRMPSIEFVKAPAPGPPDPLLDAIEGRGERREPRLKLGLGLACVFEPAEVREYAQALADVGVAELRAFVDFALMDTLNLPIGQWVEEGESTFAECIVPAFLRLQAFYASAAASQQHVLVWHE